MRTTVWDVLQLKVVGLTPGETSCLIQTVLIHKSECSVHKSALKGNSVFTPDGSFLVPTDETSRNCVCEVIPAGPKATSAQGDVEQLLTCLDCAQCFHGQHLGSHIHSPCCYG